MLYHILLILSNHLLIQRFFERMKGDQSNIYCTKNCFAVNDCVNSLSLEELSKFTFFSHSFFARNSSGNANVGIGIFVNANKNLLKSCTLQERSIEFCVIYLKN